MAAGTRVLVTICTRPSPNIVTAKSVLSKQQLFILALPGPGTLVSPTRTHCVVLCCCCVAPARRAASPTSIRGSWRVMSARYSVNKPDVDFSLKASFWGQRDVYKRLREVMFAQDRVNSWGGTRANGKQARKLNKQKFQALSARRVAGKQSGPSTRPLAVHNKQGGGFAATRQPLAAAATLIARKQPRRLP